MPWNFTRDWSSSLMAPVTSFCRLSTRVPRSASLFCLIRSVEERLVCLGGSVVPAGIFFCLISLIMSFSLVHVFYIPASFFQLIQVAFRLCGILLSLLLYDGQQGLFHIFAHRLFCSADVDIGACFQPGEQFGSMPVHFMLYIDLLLLVAGKGGVDTG